jgi:hypothetical protein
LEFLAGIFGIDCLTYTVMSNHLHIVLRSRPDVVRAWSDREVARRWLRLFPVRKNKDGTAAEPTRGEMDRIVGDSRMVAERRRRPSEICWWMRCLAEVIARRANWEEQCKRRSWKRPLSCVGTPRLTKCNLAVVASTSACRANRILARLPAADDRRRRSDCPTPIECLLPRW